MTLYINACPREESRTERLARAYLSHISDVTELIMPTSSLMPTISSLPLPTGIWAFRHS